MYAIRSYYGSPALLIADEPTTALDVTIQAVITSYSIHYTKLYDSPEGVHVRVRGAGDDG